VMLIVTKTKSGSSVLSMTTGILRLPSARTR
jgi:hypothetical protein